MSIIIVIAIAVVAFVAGLLVGRKNPKIADTAAQAAQSVKAKL